jgi:death on curing protein
MRFINLKEILVLHNRIIDQSGGSYGIRDIKLLESSLAQPFMMFNGKYLYESIIDKATALLYSLVMNHPFVDGNKRTGHAATEIFLYLNDFEISCDENEQEEVILKLASGKVSKDFLKGWLENIVIKM